MNKNGVRLLLGLLLLIASAKPLIDMIREVILEEKINDRYELQHSYAKDGWPSIIDTPEITIGSQHIGLVEQNTGKKAPLTPWDKNEKVPPGDIVTIQFVLNGEEISTPSEIWLSNRDRGSRYFSWIDILKVKDHQTGENSIAIVQRVSDDEVPMEQREWRIFYINEASGKWREKKIQFQNRSEDLLAVNLINFSGTNRLAMGYYSDILHAYPTYFFPFLYPVGSGLLGMILILTILTKSYLKKTNFSKKLLNPLK
ncbi:hypothetical protein IMZ08_16390 [Bacillus luteolus]|uniref:ResB-like domain-containing protein n=1 Tax=Litchfieldia luteola TaxID=682179 RepID=A0ABR9QMA0_9BACI|nr:hypothetical protein [Cytobacillus luteolus]MBE4909633.1 hypothetical protein [Cytobacillus luteolus]MBP1941034.1 hypothetical protein [Cytobacillus luteolus]